MAFSKKTRQEAITKIQNEEMDLLVIGGGITGAGLTLQAAAAGMKVAVLEMQDFSEGTSSRSTKQISRTLDWDIQDISLELHQIFIVCSATVYLEHRHINSCIFFHGADYITNLISYPL